MTFCLGYSRAEDDSTLRNTRETPAVYSPVQIETDEGWLYLAGVKDLFNGELVGYAMDERMTRILVMQASMSRKANCWDNAPMESFWGTLKTELASPAICQPRAGPPGDHRVHRNLLQGRQRKQARLGYLSPASFRQQYYTQQMTA